jgi:hypothetical protein
MARLFVLSQKKIKEQFPFRRNSNDDDDDDWREKKIVSFNNFWLTLTLPNIIFNAVLTRKFFRLHY